MYYKRTEKTTKTNHKNNAWIKWEYHQRGRNHKKEVSGNSRMEEYNNAVVKITKT
jgi:hypothetical protein